MMSLWVIGHVEEARYHQFVSLNSTDASTADGFQDIPRWDREVLRAALRITART